MARAGRGGTTDDVPGDRRSDRRSGARHGRSGHRRAGWAAGIVVVVLLVAGAVITTNALRGGTAGPAADRERASATPTPTPTPTPSPTPSPTPEPGTGITGPLNLLLVGVDTRIGVPGWEPHADAVLIMHVTRALDRAYLFSLPRDLVLDIPAFEKASFPGERTKLTHAMSYGSRVDGRRNTPSTAQGLELVEATVSRYTGITRFDASGVLTFEGLDELVDTLGGVDLYVDQRVVSQHRRPDGRHRAGNPNGEGYVGPQMVYEKGVRRFNGWQALDYARQRYLTGGDYTRQRHQQQLIKAIMAEIVEQRLPRDPDRLGQVLQALGETFTFQGRDQRVLDFAFALSGLRPAALTLVGLPGRSVGSGGAYRGEQLTEVGRGFLTALRGGTVDAYLNTHPDLVVADRPDPTGT